MRPGRSSDGKSIDGGARARSPASGCERSSDEREEQGRRMRAALAWSGAGVREVAGAAAILAGVGGRTTGACAGASAVTSARPGVGARACDAGAGRAHGAVGRGPVRGTCGGGPVAALGHVAIAGRGAALRTGGARRAGAIRCRYRRDAARLAIVRAAGAGHVAADAVDAEAAIAHAVLRAGAALRLRGVELSRRRGAARHQHPIVREQRRRVLPVAEAQRLPPCPGTPSSPDRLPPLCRVAAPERPAPPSLGCAPPAPRPSPERHARAPNALRPLSASRPIAVSSFLMPVA
jgi:hypothetical protein